MFENYKKQLSSNAKKVIEEGYVVLKVEDQNKLNYFHDLFTSYLSKEFKIDIKNLKNFHNYIDNQDLNNIRYGFFQYLNSFEDITEKYLALGKESIFDMVAQGSRVIEH